MYISCRICLQTSLRTFFALHEVYLTLYISIDKMNVDLIYFRLVPAKLRSMLTEEGMSFSLALRPFLLYFLTAIWRKKIQLIKTHAPKLKH